MTRLLHIAIIALLSLTALHGLAQQPDQRHVTPVKPETNTVLPPPKGTDEKTIQQYISGDSTQAIQEARKDSLRRVYKHYPKLTDLAVGINFAEPLFMAFGQSYASTDVNVTLNMWNRIQPTLELGLGWADSSPEEGSYEFKAKPAPYFKLGANYNFLFKNAPDHQVLFGIRLGYSTFSYDVNGLWVPADDDSGETVERNILGEHGHALWGEAGVGLKVKMTGNLAMGWMVRLHHIFNDSKNDYSQPWFIPGYGPRDGSLSFSMSIYYTLPLHRETTASKSDTPVIQP